LLFWRLAFAAMAKKDHVRRLNRFAALSHLGADGTGGGERLAYLLHGEGLRRTGEPGAFDPVLLKRVDGRKMSAGAIRASTPTRRNGDGPPGSGTQVITRPKTQTRKPSMYRVLLLNDDYTPMEFVVTVLVKYFSKSREDAWRIMMHVHQQGVGECGVYTYEVAETKVTQVMDYARKHQHPLQCIMEKK
jgi:ATP-dependent Clp protease adaptor protein ClpS